MLLRGGGELMSQTQLFNSSFGPDIDKLKDYLKSDTVLCKFCGSNKIVKRGHRDMSEEKNQRYKCKKCNKSCTDEITRGSNQKLWVHEEVLDFAIHGISSQKIVDMILKRAKANNENIKLTRQSVLNLIKHDCQFLSTLEYYLNHSNLSKTWEMDETYEHISKGIRCYVFNARTVETKYWLVSYASVELSKVAQVIALTLANNRAGYAPEIIRTDGYAPDLKKCSGPLCSSKVISIPKRLDYACINSVERINGIMRNAIPKGSCSYSITHLQSLIELKRLHYNFLQKHSFFRNQTPAEIVGIDLPVETWSDLFRVADYLDRTIGHDFI